MTKQEFEARVEMKVDEREFDAINVVYMNSDLEKDEFCKMWKKMNAKRISVYLKAEKEKQEKYEHISFMYSTMCLLRNLAYKSGWDSSCEKLITNKVCKELEKANIDYMEYNYIKMQNDFKKVASLVYEIQEYINKQVA